MRYISVAIDHGTSNSSVAFLRDGKPSVLKPNGFEEIMPSVVYIDRHQVRFVGDAARKAMLFNEKEEGDGHTRFKPDIGQDGRYEFSAAREVLTAPQLGGLVIGELLNCYRKATKDDPLACVITMPAKFADNAVAGTREAAQLAGLQHYPLLMEPVAAALAYGFNAADTRARWMIFDLGGGTLDVSLVSVRQGKIIVEDHAGDTRLGGSNFDRVLMGYVLQELSRKYALKSFLENNPNYRTAWNRLLLACEEAKIKLSEKEQTTVSPPGASVLCRDERGVEVKVEVPVTRAQYVSMITSDLEKTLNCCQGLLRNNSLEAQAVDRLILVGGPTKTPKLQEMLQDRLRIPFDTRIDPMTAVVQGAALYAATRENPIPPPPPPPGKVMLRLVYPRNSTLPTCEVMGVVTGTATGKGGLSVEIRRSSDNGWDSGRLPVDEAGSFAAEVRLVEQDGNLSRFTTTLLDGSGRPLAEVSEPEIFYKFIPDIPLPLPNSLMVAIQGNQTAILVQQGTRLPAKGKGDFVTTKPLSPGSGEEVLRIAVLEGVVNLLGVEDRHADCNAHVASIVIAGDDKRLTRDLPTGTHVTVRVRTDTSRHSEAIAYIRLLNAEFAASWDKEESFVIDLDQLDKRHKGLQYRLEKAERLQQAYPLPEVAEVLDIVRNVDAIKSITQELERARQGESRSSNRACMKILELAGTLNHIETLQTKPRLLQTIEQVRPLAQASEKAELAQLQQELQNLGPGSVPAELESIEARLGRIDIRVRWRPFVQLYRAKRAFPNTFRGTLEQVEAFDAAQNLLEEIDYGDGEITQSHIDRAKPAYDRLMRLWPELPGWIDNLPPNVMRPDNSDVTTKKSGTVA